MLARRINGHPVHRLRDEMDRLFEGFFQDTPYWNTLGARTYPPFNIWEDNHNLFVEAELPGMKMEDVEVLVSGKELTVKGSRSIELTEQATVHRQERPSGRFARMIQLPVDIRANDVSAELKEGVLLITLPKMAGVDPKRIEVKCASK